MLKLARQLQSDSVMRKAPGWVIRKFHVESSSSNWCFSRRWKLNPDRTWFSCVVSSQQRSVGLGRLSSRSCQGSKSRLEFIVSSLSNLNEMSFTSPNKFFGEKFFSLHAWLDTNFDIWFPFIVCYCHVISIVLLIVEFCIVKRLKELFVKK